MTRRGVVCQYVYSCGELLINLIISKTVKNEAWNCVLFIILNKIVIYLDKSLLKWKYTIFFLSNTAVIKI